METMRRQRRHFSALCESVSCDGEFVRAMTVSPSLLFSVQPPLVRSPSFKVIKSEKSDIISSFPIKLLPCLISYPYKAQNNASVMSTESVIITHVVRWSRR